MSRDVAASIKARLLRNAHASGEEFERTLTRYAVERFLYRVGASAAAERCVLKGAGLLAVWLAEPYRMTRDVDLLAFGDTSESALRHLVEGVCATAGGDDGVEFDVSHLEIDAIRADDEYAGRRARFVAWLGKARIAMQVDFGVGDAVGVALETIEYPTMLAELPAPRLRAYPRELTVAEKFEAMVSLGQRNSRMKDFHDIWALAGAFAFEGIRLTKAVAACFAGRGTPMDAAAPPPLTTAFYEDATLQERWAAYLRSGAVAVLPPASFPVIGERMLAFLAPVYGSTSASEPFNAFWASGGPWTMAEERRAS